MVTDYLRLLIMAIKRAHQPLTPKNGDLQGGKGKGHGDRLVTPESGNQKVKATA
jgi:hypothetical protein